MLFSSRSLPAGLAIAILAGCGGAQNVISTVRQSATGDGAPTPYAMPPNARGTYDGSYTETRDGKTLQGSVRVVIKENRSKITGSFDIRGHGSRLDTYFFGRVKQSPKGAFLRFQVVWLGGYGNSVNFRAHLMGATLDGEGRSQVKMGNEASSWKFKAAKASK